MGTLNVPYSTGVADVAASPDGSQVYTASAIPFFCQAGDAANVESPSRLLNTVRSWDDTTPDARTSPNNVEVDKFGRVFCGSATGPMYNVWMYINGTQSRSLKLVYDGMEPRQMVVSSDGKALIGLTDNQSFMSITLISR
jgi:hypothetical protein